MVTRDVLKVLKLHSPTARAILRTFKTSLVPINHEMHEQFHTISYTYNIPKKITRVWLAENGCILNVTRVQSCDTSANDK